MYGEAAYAECAYAESATIRPAKTPRGRANQLAQMLIDVPEVRARGYGWLIETMIAELRGSGRKRTKRDRVLELLEEHNVPPGAKLRSKLRKKLIADTDSSERTLDRALEEYQKRQR